MKIRNLLLLLSLIVLNSCIVKSLHPFYTEKTIVKEDRFIGKWEDSSGDAWEVITVQEVISREKKLDGIDKKILEKYKNSFFVSYLNKGIKSYFLAVPFKINDQLFLDFTPLDDFDDNEKVNKLKSFHAIYTHSLVKFDINNNNEISIKWLDETKIKKLFKEERIKIKHEKIGLIDNKYLLTASSEELQEFIKKYMTSSAKGKWNTDVKFTLKKIKGTPFEEEFK